MSVTVTSGRVRWATQLAALDLFLRSLYQARHLPELKNLAEYENTFYAENGTSTGFYRDYALCFFERRVAVTEKGFLGLVPSITKVGDNVAMLRGVPMPMVRRATLDPGGSYQVFGTSWFLGLGAGQGLELDCCSDREIQLV